MAGMVGSHRGEARAHVRPARAAWLGLLVAAAALLASPAGASADDPAPGAELPAGHARVEGSPAARTYAAQGPAPTYRLSDGSTVRVHVAPEFQGGPMLGRLLARLGSLLHGREMNELTVYIATASELQSSCGGGGGCYFALDQTMVVPGDDSGASMPFEMLVAHEYGHHIERNRSTNGWPASELGARHWATHEHVCEGVSAGRLFPGDQGAHYWENPGEAFAQAYAFRHHPDLVPWWWSFAAPDAGAYAAIETDVADGSGGSAKTRWAKRLNAGKGLRPEGPEHAPGRAAAGSPPRAALRALRPRPRLTRRTGVEEGPAEALPSQRRRRCRRAPLQRLRGPDDAARGPPALGQGPLRGQDPAAVGMRRTPSRQRRSASQSTLRRRTA